MTWQSTGTGSSRLCATLSAHSSLTSKRRRGNSQSFAAKVVNFFYARRVSAGSCTPTTVFAFWRRWGLVVWGAILIIIWATYLVGRRQNKSAPVWTKEEKTLLHACDKIPKSNATLPLLKHTLSVNGRTDEYGDVSDFPSLFSIVKKLIKAGVVPDNRTPIAVNFGARDGVGTAGDADPTWQLFDKLDLEGLAVEASPVFGNDLGSNFLGLQAKPVIATVSPENAVHIIRSSGLSRLDFLRIDIDGWDCDVLPKVLAEKDLETKVVVLEYNVKFPPPVKMQLATRPRAKYRSCARHHIHKCSLQYANDHIMLPADFVLAQVDRQNAFYVHKNLTSIIGIPNEGVDVQMAYRRGYAERSNRTKFMPWNEDLDHFLEVQSHVELMEEVLRYIKDGTHQQQGSVLVGCGDEMHVMEFGDSKHASDGVEQGVSC